MSYRNGSNIDFEAIFWYKAVKIDKGSLLPHCLRGEGELPLRGEDHAEILLLNILEPV